MFLPGTDPPKVGAGKHEAGDPLLLTFWMPRCKAMANFDAHSVQILVRMKDLGC